MSGSVEAVSAGAVGNGVIEGSCTAASATGCSVIVFRTSVNQSYPFGHWQSGLLLFNNNIVIEGSDSWPKRGGGGYEPGGHSPCQMVHDTNLPAPLAIICSVLHASAPLTLPASNDHPMLGS